MIERKKGGDIPGQRAKFPQLFILIFLVSFSLLRPNIAQSEDLSCATAAHKCELVREHNRVRKNAKPSPRPDLPLMSWSREVEKTAEEWPKSCSFSHDPKLNSLNMGRNIFASTYIHSAKDVVDSWEEEVADYDYSSNACEKGKVCGHYTQIVWRSSTRLGCATVVCSRNSPWGKNPWHMTVCNYVEPGNWYGKKPY